MKFITPLNPVQEFMPGLFSMLPQDGIIMRPVLIGSVGHNCPAGTDLLTHVWVLLAFDSWMPDIIRY